MNLIQISDNAGKPLEEKQLDVQKVREKLASKRGQEYWRSLEEVAGDPDFPEMLRREFPIAPRDWAPLPRRDFVKLMGAALALAGLSGCAFQPQEKIVPYVKAPEESVAGIPLFYATAMPFMGYALGVLAQASEGRPTKVEGNPDHPISGGKTDAWAQASVLDMYDPDRSAEVRLSGAPSGWSDFAGVLNTEFQKAQIDKGAGIALLTGTITAPSTLSLIRELQTALPQMKWVSYEPINRDNVRQGAQLAFGKDVHTLYHFDQANVIVSLDCDFLLEELGHVAHAREFIKGRRMTDDVTGKAKDAATATMNRLYVIESTPTITGAQADHRFPVKAAQVDGIARALAAAVGVTGVTGTADATTQKWVTEIANDLKKNRGRVLVCAGAHQPAAVHAIAHAINATLGSVGPKSAVSYHEPFDGGGAPHEAGLRDLITSMKKGEVKTAIIIDSNPAYTTPAALGFEKALAQVPLKFHMGPYNNETSALCDWHAPLAHYLESWGDARAIDGTISIIQPIIQPLYEAAHTTNELLSSMLGRQNVSDYDIVRGYYQQQLTGTPATRLQEGQTNLAFDSRWQTIVHKGIIDGTTAPTVGVTLGNLATLPPSVKVGSGMEVNFRPDPSIWDGRFANNAWLQELPKAYSRITWDNAFFVSPNTALANNWTNDQEMTLKVGDKSVTGAIFMLPGQTDDVITVHLGYGRREVGKIGTGTGFDANQIRPADGSWFLAVDEKAIQPTGGTYRIATTTQHNLIAPKGKETAWQDGSWMVSNDAKTKLINNVLSPETSDLDMDGTQGRDVVRVGTFDEFKKGKLPTSIHDKIGVPLAYPLNPPEIRALVAKVEENPDRLQGNRELEGNPSFYPRDTDYLALTPYRDASVERDAEAQSKKAGRNNVTQQWGMSVDLQSCIGCNACVIACQSENNSATVGKDQVLMGREMHWMRIDMYHRGSFENPESYVEPMFCQHCEKAPCAPVCPFNAVMETPEGINEQVYNRCVGTKYCENNCPYKVRRFNFLQYSDQISPTIELMANPNVTVRSRGVMEKCTFCIQRVNAAKWQATKEDNRDVRDGEVVTACQQVCPTDALWFGDINDPNAKVSNLKRGPFTFGILTEYNTMPRVSYMARFKNPNPDLVKVMADQEPATLEGEKEEEGGEAPEGTAGQGKVNETHEAGNKKEAASEAGGAH